MSMKPSTKIVKFLDPYSGVHALGWGPMSYCIDWIFSSVQLQLCENKVIHCYYVRNVLMLNSEIGVTRPLSRSSGWAREGVLRYILNMYFIRVIAVCHPLTISILSWKYMAYVIWIIKLICGFFLKMKAFGKSLGRLVLTCFWLIIYHSKIM